MRAPNLPTFLAALGSLLSGAACGTSSPGQAEGDEPPGLPYRVADLAPGSEDSFTPGAGQLADASGLLLFRAGEGASGLRLWRSDGSEGGTAPLSSADAGTSRGDPSSFAWVPPLLFFDADDGVHGRELWRSDGTAAGTRLVKDLAPGPGAEVLSRFTSFRGALYFFTRRSSSIARSASYTLHRSDGTPEGTFVVKELGTKSTGGSDPAVFRGPLEVGGTLFFSWGTDLWRSDGSGPGTLPFFGGLPLSGTVALARSHGRLAFVTGGFGQSRLWSTDGTVENTRLIRDLGEGARASTLHAVPSGRLFFTTEHEVWTSDGTPEGTAPVFAFAGERPRGVAVLGETLVFNVASGLWRTDGTAAGTFLLAGPTLNVQEAVAAGRWLHFSAGDGVHGTELWRTDGTAAGTTLVSDIWPGRSSGQPGTFVRAGPRLYFTAADGRTGRELWAITVGVNP